MIFRRRRIRVEMDYASLRIGSVPAASPLREAEPSPPPGATVLQPSPEISNQPESGTLIQIHGKEKNQ